MRWWHSSRGQLKNLILLSARTAWCSMQWQNQEIETTCLSRTESVMQLVRLSQAASCSKGWGLVRERQGRGGGKGMTR